MPTSDPWYQLTFSDIINFDLHDLLYIDTRQHEEKNKTDLKSF